MDDIDPRGIEAGMDAIMNGRHDLVKKGYRPIVVDIVKRYLAEALRLRPMSELPSGTMALIYGDGPENAFVGRRRGHEIFDGADRFPADNPHFRGWLPLPRPTEARAEGGDVARSSASDAG